MRPVALSAALLTLALAGGAGCSKHATSAKLEGRWRGTRVDGVGADAQNGANVFAMGTELIAKGNQIAFSTPAQKGLQATYYVESEDRNTVVVRTDKDPPQTLMFSDDGKTMIWQIDDRRRMTFVKLGN